MWEAIRSNRRRSALLIGLMGASLVALGFVIGMVFDPAAGGPIGAAAALGLWLVLLFVALSQGEQLLLLGANARQIQKEDCPRLWNVVEEMTIASGLASAPKLYIVEHDAPNAFAVGTKPEKAAVAVTSGLLKRLNRDELQGVIAHEISHISNLDARVMTIASVMLGSIVLVSDLFLRSLWYGGGRRTSRRGGQAQIVFLAVAILGAVLAPLIAQLLYFACSRRREFLADACAARFSRYPEGLASALEKIALQPSSMPEVNRALAPLFIVNPLQPFGISGLFSTHPSAETRIKILRSMGGGAGYVDYEAAFRKVTGAASRCLGESVLAVEKTVPARGAAGEPDPKQAAIERAQEVGALLGTLGDYLSVPCPCGVGIRIPGGFGGESVRCPRCGRVNSVPLAGPSPAASLAGSSPEALSSAAAPPLHYQRRGKSWESFRCSCGKTLQLSPSFIAPSLRCPSCRRIIEIAPTGAADRALSSAAPPLLP